MRNSLVAFVVMTCLSSSLTAQTVPDSLVRARKITAFFFAGAMDSVLAYSTPETRAETTAQDLRDRLATLRQRAGEEGEVIEERFVRRNGATQYWRTATWSDFNEDTVTFRLVLVNGLLAGMGFNPTRNNPPIDP